MMDKVTEQPITFTNTSPLDTHANVANYAPRVNAIVPGEVIPGSPVTALTSSPERNLLRMRSDLSDASSVMVEEARERSGKREREEVPGVAGSGGMGAHLSQRKGEEEAC